MKRPFACLECAGGGQVECYACGGETECEACGGTGLHPSKVDATAFEEASRAMLREEKQTWDWVEGGAVVGRRGPTRTLAYADFPPGDTAASRPDAPGLDAGGQG